MLAGEVPKCSLQERMQERAALDVRLERIDAGSDCDSDELDALEMRMLNNASKDHSPAHCGGAVRESGARTRPNGGDAAPAGGVWSPPKPAVPVRSPCTVMHLHCAGGQTTKFWAPISLSRMWQVLGLKLNTPEILDETSLEGRIYKLERRLKRNLCVIFPPSENFISH